MKPRKGTRLRVITVKGKREHLGTYIGETFIKIPTPKIRLDNGKIITGVECWWVTERQYIKGLNEADIAAAKLMKMKYD